MGKRLMGAVIGDISGSWYEFSKYKGRPEKLILSRDRFTDDTVLTVAVGHGMVRAFRKVSRAGLAGDEAAQKTVRAEVTESLWRFAMRYPKAGYGRTFIKWFHDAAAGLGAEPYNSWGNGSAMRASFPGWAADSLEDSLLLAKLSAEVTHNHPEGIKGAQAVAAAIYLARTGADKAEIRRYLSGFYDLDFTLDEIRPTYKFEVSCQKSVPQALNCFLEAEDFEDTIRNAISLGGDSDTQAAIAGSIAEAFYPVPEDLEARAWAKLSPMLQNELDVIDSYLNRQTDG